MKYPITTAVSLFLGAASALGAVPHPHHQDMMGYMQDLSRSFGPEPAYSEYKTSLNILSTSSFSSDPKEIAIAFAKSEIADSDFIVKSAYKTDLTGVTHVHLRQRVNGLEVTNARININVDKDGRIISYGDSFNKGKYHTQKQNHGILWRVQDGLNVISNTVSQVFFRSPVPPKGEQEYSIAQQGEPVISPSRALLSLLAFVRHKLPDPSIVTQLSAANMEPIVTSSFRSGGDADVTFTFEDVPYAESPVEARRAYMQLSNGDLVLVWDIQLELRDNWYNAHVNAHDGTVVGLVDWVSDAAYYNVIPFGKNDPSESLQHLLKDPFDTFASPVGWHAQGLQSKKQAPSFNVTIGNNAYTHANPDGGNEWKDNHRPRGKINEDGDIVFDYVADFKGQEPEEYEDAAITNLFYWCNTAHDLFYRYGFDEKSGNFQQDNFGRGRNGDNGAGDAVIANAQDGSGRNNANFATPPDGKHGKMRMYVWDQTKPMRDGDFESGIIIHEYTHGVSNRLTGDPSDSNCLGWGEAGGMGEGWGDFVATVIRMNADNTRESDFDMGSWANGGEGIRKYKYSTNLKTNPSTYRIMDRFDYWGVHAKGEVWAVMLYEVYWDLVDKYGFNPNWFPPGPADGGLTMTAEDLARVRNHIVSSGNTLALQLVIDGMKHQKCNPSFLDARDAILSADEALTGGENYCLIYSAFAKRGLGEHAKLTKEGFFEKRVENFEVPKKCNF
ncbi:Fungalysin/Thermolysin Extracellular metalloproteinase 5 [Apophysomyces sp. BC1034]|nr:Fungalysin/Thermolysin Extracellular metalloproteinase 5 [Apophysomyces sp. BC1015]KAG0177022.1 Fungalysin/Thermolysin Extracellular metalloproteinase 5 [Apophysomyces sp. BC1021]KAG0187322.1 Fungalysin/Thermolysin Extracellular metalloproteinase 5 [Apophysomyces sp. BC1034]